MVIDEQIAAAQEAANVRQIAVAHQSVANLYRLLSRLWLREIDDALADDLNSDPIRSAFLDAGGTLPSTDPSALQTLAHDYCQIFIGPRDHLPPVQSVWVKGSFQGAPADSMHAYLDILGLDVNESILDHLGNELRAMARIVESIAAEADATNRRTLERMAARFFCDHLAWCRPLTEQVTLKAKSEFYQSLGRVTGEFLAGESEHWSGHGERAVDPIQLRPST